MNNEAEEYAGEGEPLEIEQPKDATHMLSRLRLLGAVSAIVTFSGSGDSGQVDAVDVFDAQDHGIDIDKEMIAWTTEAQQFDQASNTWVMKKSSEPRPLREAIESLFYEADNKLGHDWSNNDGGNGEMTISFATSPPSIQVEYRIAYTEYTNHSYSFSGVGE